MSFLLVAMSVVAVIAAVIAVIIVLILIIGGAKRGEVKEWFLYVFVWVAWWFNVRKWDEAKAERLIRLMHTSALKKDSLYDGPVQVLCYTWTADGVMVVTTGEKEHEFNTRAFDRLLLGPLSVDPITEQTAWAQHDQAMANHMAMVAKFGGAGKRSFVAG